MLAGVALRAALAALSVAGRAWGAMVLACLALVLAVTCMVGRTLLAGSLGLHPAFSDWLVLFAAIAAGLTVAELLGRLGRAGRLPADPAAGLRLPGWPVLVLTAVAATVPAYAVTAAGVTQASCTDFDSTRTQLTAQSDRGFPVRLSWSSAGGCEPIDATIVAVGSPVSGGGRRYRASLALHGGSGSVEVRGPSPQDQLFADKCAVTYTLRLVDAQGHETKAQAKAVTCRG